MSEFRIDQIKSQDATRGPDVAGITTFTETSGIVMPSGDTAYRGGRGRGIFGSGNTPGATNVIDYITIATTGNAVDFGDDAFSRQEHCAAFASSTRGIFAGGYNPGPSNMSGNIEYITISSTGNALFFGDLPIGTGQNCGTSDSTRGLSMGGASPATPAVVADTEYVTIATRGNAADFGDLLEARWYAGACASPTRGFVAGGTQPGWTNIIQFVTIQTLGNAEDWGDLTDTTNGQGSGKHSACSNSTRGLVGGGETSPGPHDDRVHYWSLASKGNSQDFGNLTDAREYLGSTSSSTRGLWAGGQDPAKFDIIDYVTISTLGDATDFGDLTVARRFCMGLSDVHGGLG